MGNLVSRCCMNLLTTARDHGLTFYLKVVNKWDGNKEKKFRCIGKNDKGHLMVDKTTFF